MCYILYGATDKAINNDDYENASRKSHYKLSIGTKHDVKMCIINDSYEFRVTDWVCDCDFPVGKGDENAEQLVDLAGLICDLKNARDSKCIYIVKAWAGKRYKSEKRVHINDIDIISFLASMETDCLYQIDLR